MKKTDQFRSSTALGRYKSVVLKIACFAAIVPGIAWSAPASSSSTDAASSSPQAIALSTQAADPAGHAADSSTQASGLSTQATDLSPLQAIALPTQAIESPTQESDLATNATELSAQGIVSPAQFQTIRIGGTVSYQVSGSSVNMQAGSVRNDRSSGSVSGTLKLQLWATSSPYSGGPSITGYKFGEYTLGQLNGGFQFTNINVNVSFTSPPAGTYYVSMVLAEYQGASGYQISDYRTFSGTATFGGGGGSLQLVGTVSYQVSGSNVNMRADSVRNTNTGGTSGTLKLQLWATSSPFAGGTITGYKFGEYTLGQLNGGFQFTNINVNVPFTSPPAGTYYVSMLLAEYQGAPGYQSVDYRTFSGTATFGGGGSATIAQYFPFASSVGNNWYFDNQIGYIYPYSNGICYFNTYGRYYYPGAGSFDYSGGVYIYDFYYGSWTYTSKSVWSYVYYYSVGRWFSNSFF